MSALLALANEADAQLVRQEASQRALAFAGQPAPAASDSAARTTALARVEAWWAAQRARARWDAGRGAFVTEP
jgi:hypothetical protein